jgi:hypothetical protein
MDVTLVWLHCDAEGKVGVCERSEGAYFEIPAESYLALDVRYHPFAHWDFGTVDDHDGRLAA